MRGWVLVLAVAAFLVGAWFLARRMPKEAPADFARARVGAAPTTRVQTDLARASAPRFPTSTLPPVAPPAGFDPLAGVGGVDRGLF